MNAYDEERRAMDQHKADAEFVRRCELVGLGAAAMLKALHPNASGDNPGVIAAAIQAAGAMQETILLGGDDMGFDDE